MIEYYNYLPRLQSFSEILYNWANELQIAFVDFDAIYYSTDKNIDEHFEGLKNEFKKIIIVEQHPFLKYSDLNYLQLRKLLIDIGNKHSLQLYWLTANYNNWDDIDSNVCFFPHWFFELRANHPRETIESFEWPKTRKYNFSCNNMANYRSEKIYNYIECFRRHRLDWKLSLYNHPHAKITELPINQVPYITIDQIEIWNREIKSNIRLYEYDLYIEKPQNPFNIFFPGHVDAYCNLVMEHSMTIEIMSEKSYKPFLASQIPVFCAKAGTCAMLEKLGFDLFYDFINHKEYDNIADSPADDSLEWIQRIEKVHDLIDQLYLTNFQDFIHSTDTKHRLEKNVDHFFSQHIDLAVLEKLNQLIKYE